MMFLFRKSTRLLAWCMCNCNKSNCYWFSSEQIWDRWQCAQYVIIIIFQDKIWWYSMYLIYNNYLFFRAIVKYTSVIIIVLLGYVMDKTIVYGITYYFFSSEYKIINMCNNYCFSFFKLNIRSCIFRKNTCY